tara:strand:- start:137 stop:358 length:222 start_codon:yes stop_codon:yes gene_type:complete
MPISLRDKAIAALQFAMNKRYNTELTFPMVEHWVGSDASIETIDEYTSEVDAGDDTAVTPSDVTSLWEESLED